jgi:hypothetical protein
MPEVAIGAGLTTLIVALAFGGLREVLGTQERVASRVERQESIRRLGARLRSDVARMVPGKIRVSSTRRTLALKLQRPYEESADDAGEEDPPPLTETVTVLYAWDPEDTDEETFSLTRRVRGPEGWEGAEEPIPLARGVSEAGFTLVEGERGWVRASLQLPDEGSGELLAALPEG